AAGLTHNGVDRCQSETSSLSLRLSGKKRLEYAGARGRIHSRSGILHGEDNVVAGGNMLLAVVGARHAHNLGADGQSTSGRHGVSGIQRQVKNRLLQFRTIYLNQTRIDV